MTNDEATSYDGEIDGYAPAEQAPPQEDLEKLAEHAAKWLDNAIDAKVVYQTDWELYRLYVKGDQLVARNKDTGEIIRLSKDDSKRFKSVNNQLRPTSRSLVAKLTAQVPTVRVIPATTDVPEQYGARVATGVLQYFRRKENLDLKYLELCEYLPAFGNSFIGACWDRDSGRKMAVCSTCQYYDMSEKAVGTPCPQCTQQRQDELAIQQTEQEAMDGEAMGQVLAHLPPDVVPSPDMLPVDRPQAELKPLGPLQPHVEPPALVEAHEGDARSYVYDPRDVFVPRGIVHLHQAGVVATRRIMTVPEARRRFPEYAKYISADKGLYGDKEAALRYGDTRGLNYNIVTDYLADHCWVYEFHERPTEEYPKGRLFYMINKQIVEYHAESPYDCLDRVPLFHFGFDWNPGEFWREPYVAQAWHRQRELNHAETHIREHTEQLVKPNLLIPQGAEISVDDFDFGTFKGIKFYAAQGTPTWQNPPPMPQGLWQRKQDLAADIRTQAAITEQEIGAEASDPNGRAMAIVNAETDRQVGPITSRNNAEFCEFNRAVLQLYQKFATPERVALVVGPEGMQTFSFGELNLSPGWDIDLEATDGLSRNPSIRYNETLQLYQATQGAAFMNQQTGQMDFKKFSRMAKLNLADDGYDTDNMMRATAAAVPYKLKNGQTWQPRIYDRPDIFSDELYAWLIGPGDREDPNLLQQVTQVWQFYAQWAATGAMGQVPPTGGMQQGSMVGQGGMSAPGGSPNNPGMLGTDLAPGLGQQANAMVSQADQTGEDLAQKGMQREG